MKETRGYKIQSTASKLFTIWVILQLVLILPVGFLLGELSWELGFVMFWGWLVAAINSGVNIFIGYLVYLIVDAYGDIVDNNSKQTEILKRLLPDNDISENTKQIQKSVPDEPIVAVINNEIISSSEPVPIEECTPVIDGDKLTCTKCGAVQKIDRDSCFKCGAEFIK